MSADEPTHLDSLQLVAHRSGEENDRRIGVLLTEIEQLKAQMLALQAMDAEGVPLYESDDEGLGVAVDEPADFAAAVASRRGGGAGTERLLEPTFDEFAEDGVADSPSPSSLLAKEADLKPLEPSFAEHDADEDWTQGLRKEMEQHRHEKLGHASREKLVVSWDTCDRILWSMRDVLASFERAVTGSSAPFAVEIPSGAASSRPRTPRRDPYVDAYIKSLTSRHVSCGER